MKVILSGGAGYIGTHTALELLESGHKVTVVDDYSNSYRETTERIETSFGSSLTIVKGNAGDESLLADLFSSGIDAVVQFAAKKSIPESLRYPIDYLYGNIVPLLSQVKVQQRYPESVWLYSSSCTVYAPSLHDLDEVSLIAPSHPYGESKWYGERLLEAMSHKYNNRGMILRYFNPIGARVDLGLGERARSSYRMVSDHIYQSLVSEAEFKIHGGDYPTRDGSPERDFVDVSDIARAHRLALEHLKEGNFVPLVVNLGSGRGVTIQEFYAMTAELFGAKPRLIFGDRRLGDTARSVAAVELANEILGWRPFIPLEQSIENFISFNRYLT